LPQSVKFSLGILQDNRERVFTNAHALDEASVLFSGTVHQILGPSVTKGTVAGIRQIRAGILQSRLQVSGSPHSADPTQLGSDAAALPGDHMAGRAAAGVVESFAS